MENKIEILKGDITDLQVDAIVNAANKWLMGGGGVDGAIHHKAGQDLDVACKKLNGCQTGEAKITPGFNLKAKYIIHTVAPIWYENYLEDKEELLRNCYRNSYLLAKEHNLKTIAFPCLGAGVYQVPINISAKIAIEEAFNHISSFDKIILICFTDEDYEHYKNYFNLKSQLFSLTQN